MPGFVIHLAIAKIYEKNNEIENIVDFERGIIAPDLEKNKDISHYKRKSRKSDLNYFLQVMGNLDDYKEGYFLHLVADHLFYECFLEKWTPEIYDDYDRLNNGIVEKYKIKLPKEVKEVVKPNNEKLVLLNEDMIYKFIDCVGKIDIRKIISERGDYQKHIECEYMKQIKGIV